MNLDTFTTMLLIIVPSLSTIIGFIAVVIKIIKTVKKIQPEMTDLVKKEITNKMNKSFEDLAIMKTKISSIEKFLVEEKKKRG